MPDKGLRAKKRLSSVTLLLFATVVILLLVYAFARISDRSFADGALGNLFATVIGLIIGVPIALEINRIQEKERLKIEEQQDLTANRDRLQALFLRTRDEIYLNKQRLDRFKDVLHKPRSFRDAHWEWVIAISTSFSFASYEDYIASGIRDQLTSELDNEIQTAYSMLKGLQQRVSEAYTAEGYYSSGESDQEKADYQIQYVKDLTRETDRRFEQCQKTIKRYQGIILN